MQYLPTKLSEKQKISTEKKKKNCNKIIKFIESGLTNFQRQRKFEHKNEEIELTNTFY